MGVTIEQCIEVMDRILAGHVLSIVDYQAMRDASQLVKEYKERPNQVNRPDACGDICDGYCLDCDGCENPIDPN